MKKQIFKALVAILVVITSLQTNAQIEAEEATVNMNGETSLTVGNIPKVTWNDGKVINTGLGSMYNVNGKIGIGVSNPLESLHLNGNIRGHHSSGAATINTDYGYVMIGPTNSTAMHFMTDRGQFYFNKKLTIETGVINTYGGSSLEFQHTGSTKMSISPIGNVGIGNLAPSYKLDVNGTINATDILINGSPISAGGSLWSSNGSNIYYNVGSVGIGANDPSKMLHLKGGSGQTITTAPEIRFEQVLGSEIDGHVTIPTYFWDIKQAENEILFSAFYLGSDGSSSSPENDIIFGWNGINTPGLTLQAGVANSTKIEFNNTGGMIPQWIHASNDGNNSVMFFSSEKFMFGVDGGTPFKILPSGYVYAGNLGIGTETPQDKLHVATGNAIFDNQVGIGTAPHSDYKLSVNGKIICEELKVELNNPWPDYVFEESYNLSSLKEVESFIKENKHLPNIPSAKEVEENGFTVGEMNAKLLEKIEELTLYTIDQQKVLENQQKFMENQQKEIEALKAELKEMKSAK